MPAPSPFDAFLKALEKRLRVDDIETFWDCEEAFSRLLEPAHVRELANEGLRRLATDPSSPSESNPTELVLHVGGGIALAVSRLPKRRYLHVLPYHAMYGVVAGGPVQFQRFEAPKDFTPDVFNPVLKLVPGESGALNQGDTLRLAAGTSAADFTASQPALLLKFVTTALLPLEWLFNRDTLQAWQANDADISFTQLRVAADVLGKLAHQSSIEPLKLMATHGHHAVRWAGITNLGRINKTEAVARLKEAVNDPHPHIRNAASKTLRKVRP